MATKKSFKNENPALRFISLENIPETDAPDPPTASPFLPAIPAPETMTGEAATRQHQATPPMKPNPLYVETKSRRLNLLVQPSLHEKIKEIARARGASVNDTIHQALQKYADGFSSSGGK